MVLAVLVVLRGKKERWVLDGAELCVCMGKL